MSEMLLLYALLLAQQNEEESSSSDENTDYEEAQKASRRQQTSSSNRNRQNSVVKRSEKVTSKTPIGVRNKTKIMQNTKKRHNVSHSSSEEQKVKRTKAEPTISNPDSELQNENSTNDINTEESIMHNVPDSSSEEQRVKITKTEPTISKPNINLRNENSTKDINTEESINDCCSVIITHRNYPKMKLSCREIRKIKENLLTEIDKTENIGTNLGFLSCVLEDGWLLLNCQNTDTRDWVMNIINKLNNTLKMDLKATNSIALQPKTFICSLNIPLEDVMPPDALKYRLAKQNVELLTEEWCFLNIIKSEEGGECVSYRIDEKSRDVIEARGCKLFLNFSQISVQTTPD